MSLMLNDCEFLWLIRGYKLNSLLYRNPKKTDYKPLLNAIKALLL